MRSALLTLILAGGAMGAAIQKRSAPPKWGGVNIVSDTFLLIFCQYYERYKNDG